MPKVKKVSQIIVVHEGYSAQTSIRYGEKHVQDTFVAKHLGYSSETSTPMQKYGHMWLANCDLLTLSNLVCALMRMCKKYMAH